MRASALTFSEARAPSPELVDALQSVGLEGQLTFLGKANVTSLKALQMHSLDELEDSLRRPQAHGKAFVFGPFERRMLLSLGLRDGVAAAAPAAHGASLDFGGSLFDELGKPTGPEAPPPPLPVSGVLKRSSLCCGSPRGCWLRARRGVGR